MRRGISERTFYGYNPLPNVDEKGLLDAAGLELTEPMRGKPFAFNWKYASGLDAEFVDLKPGDHVQLRESEVPDFLTKSQVAIGMVVVKDIEDRDEVVTESIRGLRKALEFYRSRGKPKLQEIRKAKGYSREDMDDYKYDHWPYYLNEAKAGAIQEELKRLAAEQRELKSEEAEA